MNTKLMFLKSNLLLAFLLWFPIWLFSRDAPTTNAGTATVCPGTAVAIPITVNNFTTISGVSLRMDYNPQLMTYSSYSNANAAFSEMLINDVTISATQHKIIVVWSNVDAVTLSTGTKLMDMNFTYLSGNAALVFDNTSNNGGDCEYADENGDPMNDSPTTSFYHDGGVTSLFPFAAGSISGPDNICKGAAGQVYSVSSIPNVTGYVWSVPTGCAIMSGSNTKSITLDCSASTVSGSISVYGTNTCGNGSASVFDVIVNSKPSSVTATASPNPIFIGATLALSSGATGATGWDWSGPSGFTSTSQSPTIPGITTAGAGVYTLIASNFCGSAAATNTASVLVTVPLPEPTNYPVSFSAHNIHLQWTDATGTVLPTGYLVRMSSVGFDAITTPIDATPVADSPANQNIAYGIQNAWFTNLAPNCTYYFKLFGYTGSGSSIDYKTDGSVQQAIITTSP